MKCSNCGHAFHGDDVCGVDGCTCASGTAVEMTSAELLSLSLDDFHRHRLAAERVSLAVSDTPATDPDPNAAAPPISEEQPSADAAMDGPKFRIPIGISEGVMTSKGIF